MKTRLIVVSAVAVMALFLTSSAYAQTCVGSACPDVVFHIGDVGGIGETNILFNSKVLPNGPGTMIAGFDKKIHTQVDFSTTPPPDIFSSGGQSDIDPVPDTDVIHNLTITVPGGGSWDDFILNPGTNKQASSHGGDDLFAEVTLTNGDTAKFGPWGTKDSGNNFLTICMVGTGKDGCVPASDTGEGTQPDVVKIVLTSAMGFADLKQPRISGIEGGVVVPEPSSMLLQGSGMLALAGLLRRKLLHSAARNTEEGNQGTFQS
jgi:hypothetical protein